MINDTARYQRVTTAADLARVDWAIQGDPEPNYRRACGLWLGLNDMPQFKK